ncbi:MAG: class I SAM-dependent methyltransferase [Dehalococcoidia bacterium]
MARFRDQFRQPHGRIGRFAGYLMAAANAGMNRFTVQLMEVQPDDRILEIGFGPGNLIRRLAEGTSCATVAGVDPSDVMLAQASKRNAAAIDDGRVQLQTGTISSLPYPDAGFTKVCSVNTIYFWPDPASDLREVHRVLQPGGRCYLTFRVKHRAGRRPTVRVTRDGIADEPVAQTVAALRAAGFTGIRSKMRRFLFVTAMCLVAEKRAP